MQRFSPFVILYIIWGFSLSQAITSREIIIHRNFPIFDIAYLHAAVLQLEIDLKQSSHEIN